MHTPLETRPREKQQGEKKKKSVRTYTRREQCAGKQAGQSLAHPTKKAHARKTHSPARDKRRARNKTAMRPSPFRPPPRQLCHF